MKRHFALLALLSGVVFLSRACVADDARPVVDASKVPAEKAGDAKLPTLHLVGDSTVRASGMEGKVGWGERIKPLFDARKINVVSDAIAGRSARTFYNEGRWAAVAKALKPGDFVIIQFGHNDQGAIGDPANKGRADGKGVGDEIVVDTLPASKGEKVHTFGWYMAQFVAEARAKQATAIIVSPVPHKQRWETERDFANIAAWDAQVAAAHDARFFDLTLIVTAEYKKLGRDKVEALFADKGTHTTADGAMLNARCVVAGLRTLHGDPLKAFLSDQGAAIAAAALPTTTPAH